MVPYILSVTLLLWMTLCIIIKLQFPFWNIQPVYHQYDLWRFLYTTPFIVHKQKPWKTKYVDQQQVFTFSKENLSQKQINYLLQLLQGYTVPEDQNVIYNINEKQLTSMFREHQHECYVSFYYRQTPVPSETTLSFHNIHYQQAPIATMYSFPVVLNVLPSRSGTQYTQLSIPFHSHPINKHEEDLTISRTLFQTHNYNYIERHPKEKVSMFKKQGALHNGIIPIVEWYSYTYYIGQLPPMQQFDDITMTNIHTNNHTLLEQTFTNQCVSGSPKQFSLWVTTHFSHILHQIKEEELYVYMLHQNMRPLAFYFFKKSPMEYEEPEGKTMELVASINLQQSLEIFYKGFLQGLHNVRKANKNHKYIIIQQSSHNTLLFPLWNQQYQYIQRDQQAYYLFNYIVPQSPFASSSTFILL